MEVHNIPLPSFDEWPPFPQTRLTLGLGIRGSWAHELNVLPQYS